VTEPAKKSIVRRIVGHPAFLLIAGLIIVVAAMSVGGAILQAAMPEPVKTDVTDLVGYIIVSTFCIAGYWLFTRFVEQKPFADFGLPGAGREWLFGVAIGAGVMTLVVGIMALLGGYKVIGQNGPDVLIGVLGVAIISGITEEILFRGIIFRFFEQWLGSYFALAVSALFFGAVHLGNPNASWLAAFAIAIEAGILLGAVYMLTRRLWAAIGLHMAWNSVQGGVFGIKVSGTDVPGLLISKTSGSDLLTGGAFGAEASLPAIILCTAVGLYFFWRAKQKGQVIAPSLHRFQTGEAAPAEQ
jgi:membrane protease YdiL (CAAX protease family)